MSIVQNKCDRTGNLINIKVKYLDDHIECFTMNEDASGSELFQKISIRMQLFESYFFGLQYVSFQSDLCWLDLRKAIRRQMDYKNEFAYEFCIKFYTPDPNLLHDNLTKKLFVLQLKKDLTNGELICSESTKILLAGLFLQLQYLESMIFPSEDVEHFFTNLFNDQSLSSEFIDQCLKFHKTLQCQTVNETHFDLLEIVRKIDFYGMKLHPAKDNEGLSLNLAVYHMGIVIFQKYTKINTFNWSKIRKLSFKRKRFLIKLHPEEYLELFVLWVIQGFYKDTLEFYFDSRDSCKNFWKKCIEHHAFFRTHSNSSSSHSKPTQKYRFRRSFSGSRFRYVGLTQFELDQFHKDSHQIDNVFQRSESAGRLTSAKSSVLHLSRRNSESKYNSNFSLSVNIKPSISETLCINNNEPKISQNHVPVTTNKCRLERRQSALKDSKNPSANSKNPDSKLFNTNCPKPIDSSNSNEQKCFQSSSFIGTNERPFGKLSSTSTRKKPVPQSLTYTSEFVSDKDSPDLISPKRNIRSQFDEYVFVPNLIAQISQTECSTIKASKSFDDIEATDSNGKPFSFTSEMISSELILRSVEKDFFFNEVSYLNEIQILLKIINTCINDDGELSEKITSIQTHLNVMGKASIEMIKKLEIVVRMNIPNTVSSWKHVHQFLSIISDYGRQVHDTLNGFIAEIKDFILSLLRSNFSSKSFNCYEISNNQENKRNLVRLFISPIVQQRAHLKSLSMFLLLIPADNEENMICQDEIYRIKDSLIAAQDLEQFAHVALITHVVRGLLVSHDFDFHEILNYQPIRLGWLQKLTAKGASNRILILISDKLICSKKNQYLQYVIEHQWSLCNIRVGTISEMTKFTNGYDVVSSPFDSNTIMLLDNQAKDSRLSSFVFLADSKQTRTAWLNEIKRTSSKCSVVSTTIQNHSRDVAAKFDSTNGTMCWTDKYYLIDLCWHERFSLSKYEMGFLFGFSLSTYLLRKYKSSNSWQRLWVVLTDCHLHFYQSHIAPQAIASLCLVGFQISEPSVEDSITKLWVIKLEKKLKTCFLRTENQYYYYRWLTALSYCTFSDTL